MSNAEKKDASKVKKKDPKEPKESKESKEAKASQDQPVHAFILKSKPQSLKAAESYLIHRGWALKSSDRMKEALVYLIQKKPDYFFLPSDFPNKKVRILPRLIAQAFPSVTVIGYCESTSPSALGALRDLGLEFVLYPPISGTTLERIILRIERGAEKKSKTEIISGSKSTRESQTQILKGSKYQKEMDDDPELLEAQKALQSMIHSVGGGKDADGGLIPTGESSPLSDADGASDIDWDANSPEADTSSSADPGDSTESAAQRKKDYLLEGESDENELAQAENSPRSKTGNKTSRKPKKSSNTEAPNTADSMSDEDLLLELQKQAQDTTDPDGSIDSSKPNSFLKTPDTQDRDSFGNVEVNENETVFVRGLNQAVRESVHVNGSSGPVEKIKIISNAVCIIVESPKFNGYLVAASPEPDVNFFDRVRKRLFEVLKTYGEEVEGDQAAMGIKIHSVDFEPWAVAQAEFLKKAAHNGKEIAMAFFPTNDTKTELSESFAENMVALKMEDIKADAEVEFDLYIFLPENKKYILYTPQGRPLAKSQRDRLSGRGMTKMHLRKDSSAQVSKYRAQNFINDRIEEFREKKSRKPA